MGRQHGAADLESLAIDEDAMAVDDVDMRMCDEVICDIGKCPGQQHVIAVKIGHDLALDAGKPRLIALDCPLSGSLLQLRLSPRLFRRSSVPSIEAPSC